MKILVCFFILLSLFLVGCFRENKLSENSNKPLEIPNSPPILEITEDLKGTWDVTGKLLYFRLYENKIAELEIIDYEKNRPYTINETKDVAKKVIVEITADNFQKINNLLNSDDFRKLEKVYQQKISCVDAFMDFEIKTTKSIKFENFCGINELYSQTRYSKLPKVINDLFSLIETERAKPQLKNLSN
jgi:uncharacterized protein YcfL